MRKIWGSVFAITGLVACPCHLPLTLPLLLGVLGGTGVGTLIATNTGLIYGLMTGYFIVGIGVGLYLIYKKRASGGEACEVDLSKQAAQTQSLHLQSRKNRI